VAVEARRARDVGCGDLEVADLAAAILSKKRGSAKVPVAAGLVLMAAGLAVMASSTVGSSLGH
jgi:hypothetical protein